MATDAKPRQRSRAWAWLIALVLIATPVLYWAAFLRTPTAGAAGRQENQISELLHLPEDDARITDLDDLFTKNPEELVNREAHFERMRVLEIAGDGAFWIGAKPETRDRILVILCGPSASAPEQKERLTIRSGDAIEIRAVLRRFLGVAEARERWGLPGVDQAILAEQKLYLETDRASVRKLEPRSD